MFTETSYELRYTLSGNEKDYTVHSSYPTIEDLQSNATDAVKELNSKGITHIWAMKVERLIR